MASRRSSQKNTRIRKTSSSRSQREALRAARQRRKRLRNLALSLTGLLVVGFFAFLIIRSSLNKPGQSVTNMGNTHIASEQTNAVSYNSRPPTSGPHIGQLASWGVHTDPIPDAVQIHNLEDGGVGIWYNCPQGCPELVSQLEGVVATGGEDRLLLAPYPDTDTRITLTAWNRIDQLETFDEARIRAFIRAYRGIDHHR